jgi:citrate lyase subunit beta/citryl-CoA lyase
MLFCPGDRPDRFPKALASADSILIDLEDAVPLAAKTRARDIVRDKLKDLPLHRTVVRINSPRTEHGQADLLALRETGLRFVMVPKAEEPGDVAAAAPMAVIALCETARGIDRASTIARTPGCVALMWGGEDLTADIGGRRSRGIDGAYLPHVQYARSKVLIASAASKRQAWDGVFLEIGNLTGLEHECAEAVSMGFAAKAAIHPSHSSTIRNSYLPTTDQLQWARRVMATIGDGESAVMSIDGHMVDGPLIAMAERVLAASNAEECD